MLISGSLDDVVGTRLVINCCFLCFCLCLEMNLLVAPVFFLSRSNWFFIMLSIACVFGPSFVLGYLGFELCVGFL